MVRRCSKKRYLAPRAATAVRQAQDAEVGNGVEREGEQVEADQEAGQGLLAVAEVVLEVVALGLEHVEGLVLDLPAGAAARGQFGDSVRGDRQVGDEGCCGRCVLPAALKISMENQLTVGRRRCRATGLR